MVASRTALLGKPLSGWRLQFYTVIFEADTRAGRWFDQCLIAVILASVAVVVADSVQDIAQRHHAMLNAAEWGLTLIFTLEYLARLACVRHPLRYALSFYGVVDLLALLPTYLALRASVRKIMVFVSAVLMIVLVIGTLMYVVEGSANGFTSIPTAVYWAITTMTTVGLGDITPKTDLGRLIASAMMLLGWGTLVVPTGIVTAELTQAHKRHTTTRSCQACLSEGPLPDAKFCLHCGTHFVHF